MSEQRLPSTRNGRRAMDMVRKIALIATTIVAVGATITLLGAGFSTVHQVAENTAGLAVVSKKVTVLESFKNDDHYMTCYMFQKVNPDGVPASCSLALRER